MKIEDFEAGRYCYLLNKSVNHTCFIKATFILQSINQYDHFVVKVIDGELIEKHCRSNNTYNFNSDDLTYDPYLPEHIKQNIFNLEQTLENLDKLEKKCIKT